MTSVRNRPDPAGFVDTPPAASPLGERRNELWATHPIRRGAGPADVAARLPSTT
jgi:hypothetical protein